MPNQRLTLGVNGRVAGSLAMQQVWNDYTCHRVAGCVDSWDERNRFAIRRARAGCISDEQEIMPLARQASPSPVSIVARSAGSEVGDFAHIFVNGIDAAQNSRGYNIVVINEKTGAIEASAAFDTFASAEESARLAQFIEKIPTGRIVAVAGARRGIALFERGSGQRAALNRRAGGFARQVPLVARDHRRQGRGAGQRVGSGK